MILRSFIILSLLSCLFACSSNPVEQSDLTLAKEAIEKREWFYAERLLERFLNTSDNASLRWEAWHFLIESSQHTGASSSVFRMYYDNMLQEFLDDEKKRKVVLYGLAELLKETQDYDAALDTLNVYLSLENLTTNEIFIATQKSVEIYLHTGQFEDAENALYNCLGLEISLEDSAVCLYELADLKAGRGALNEAIDLATQVLEIDTFSIVHGKAAFLLGDIAEQQRNYKKALVYFEQAKELYPNLLAVENRISFLANILK